MDWSKPTALTVWLHGWPEPLELRELVETYGPGGTNANHPGDPMFEAAAVWDS